MSFKCGIVGLPNVGKSTLFNALTNSSKAQAANFPFCTIDPNVGVVPVPDERLNNLSKVSKSKKIINTTISFVDIVEKARAEGRKPSPEELRAAIRGAMGSGNEPTSVDVEVQIEEAP